MATLSDYKTALHQAVGEEKFPLALAHLQLVRDFLVLQKRKELESCASNQERINLLNKWFGNFVVEETKNFTALLAEKHQLALLDEFGKEEGSAKKITVTLAKPLNQELRQWLVKELETIYGHVAVKFGEDSSLIGGIKIRVGDREVDYSLKSKLVIA